MQTASLELLCTHVLFTFLITCGKRYGVHILQIHTVKREVSLWASYFSTCTWISKQYLLWPRPNFHADEICVDSYFIFPIWHFQGLISPSVLKPEQFPLVHVSGTTSCFCTCRTQYLCESYTELNWICSRVLRLAVLQWITTRWRGN